MTQHNFNELAGFDVEEESTSSTNSELLNSDDVQSFETPSGWSSNPVVRVSVVGAVIGGILSLVAVLFGAFRPSPVAQQPETPSTSESSGQTAEELAELKAQKDKLQKEVLLKEQEKLTEQPQQKSSEESTKPKAATKPASKPAPKSQPQQEKPKTQPQPAAQPLPVVNPPQRRVSSPVQPIPRSVSPVPRPVVNSQPVRSLPAPTPRPVSQPSPVAPPESFPVESSNPSELIAEARAAGSFGTGGEGDKKPSPALPTSPAVLDSVPKQVAGIPNQQVAPNEQPLAPKEPVEKLESEQQPPPTTLAIGSSAKAVVETAWVSSDEESPKQVLVELTEALPATDGGDGLSAGTKLIAEIGGINSGGMVDAKIVAVVRAGQQERLPLDALILSGSSGTPLVAKRQGGDVGTELARLDVEGALISGVGEITSGSGGIESFIPRGGNNKGDVLGRFLDGALDKTLDTLEERNETQKEELQNRSVTWHLAQGTTVQVTIQGTVSLEPSENSAKKQPPQPETTPNFFPPGVDEEGYFTSTTTPVAVPVRDEVSPPELESLSEISETPLPPASVNNPPVQQQGGVQSPNPTVHSEPSVVKVWAGSGTNISFIPTGETIIRAWLDDPSMVTVDFDEPLCAAEAQGCTSGSPSVVHLRLIEDVKVPNIPSANNSLLTVITETATGAQNLYSFRIERGAGEPEYHSLEISGN